MINATTVRHEHWYIKDVSELRLTFSMKTLNHTLVVESSKVEARGERVKKHGIGELPSRI